MLKLGPHSLVRIFAFWFMWLQSDIGIGDVKLFLVKWKLNLLRLTLLGVHWFALQILASDLYWLSSALHLLASSLDDFPRCLSVKSCIAIDSLQTIAGKKLFELYFWIREKTCFFNLSYPIKLNLLRFVSALFEGAMCDNSFLPDFTLSLRDLEIAYDVDRDVFSVIFVIRPCFGDVFV